MKKLFLYISLLSSSMAYCQDTLIYYQVSPYGSNGIADSDYYSKVFIDYFYKKESKRCRKFEQQILSDSSIISKINRDFNFCKLNTEYGTIRLYKILLHRFFRTPALAFVFYRLDGRLVVLDRYSGIPNKKKLVSLLEKALIQYKDKSKLVSVNKPFYIDSSYMRSRFCEPFKLEVIKNPSINSKNDVSKLSNGKPTLIFFSTNSCAPCKEFECDVLADTLIANKLTELTIIKFDDSTLDGIKALKIFKVGYFPTFLFYSSDSYRKKWSGYGKKDQFLKMIGE